jgi:hypothetical protein
MAQTSRPRRCTRNRRPASISSRILEKDRLASVAEMRLADPGLSDFLAIGQIIVGFGGIVKPAYRAA